MKSGAARARLASTMRTHRDRAPRMTCMSYRRACSPHVWCGTKDPHLVIVHSELRIEMPGKVSRASSLRRRPHARAASTLVNQRNTRRRAAAAETTTIIVEQTAGESWRRRCLTRAAAFDPRRADLPCRPSYSRVESHRRDDWRSDPRRDQYRREAPQSGSTLSSARGEQPWLVTGPLQSGFS